MHTKGPWEYVTERDEQGQRKIYSPVGQYTVAIPMSHADDARLIAAAPDLLEACRAVADDTTHPIKGDLQAKLRAAIARAEGRG